MADFINKFNTEEDFNLVKTELKKQEYENK